MTFKAKDLSTLSHANGFTLWHYRTSDDVEEVKSDDYFNDAFTMFREGDFVFVNAEIGSTPSHGCVVVTESNQDGVDIAQIISFGTVLGSAS